MDIRSSKTGNFNSSATPKIESRRKAVGAFKDAVENGAQTGEFSRLSVLKDLGNQLQIKAERMRLLARAEEGLDEEGFNPYVTQTITAAKLKDKDSRDAPVVKEHASKIPVSSARQRHREKKTKTKKTSNVDIKQYRPGYTWNRGGRVRELKIRNLARKFLYIWKRRVFGRVTPSQASNHHNQKLLKLVFSEWHLLWWEARREWRLVVRAECHHRYVLWLKTFRAWKEFVVKRRVRNTKLALAEQHGSCKLTRKCLDAWIVYTECRRHKQEKAHSAEDHYNTNLLRLAWYRWKSQHELLHHRQRMEDVALQFWAYRIQAQHWFIWQHRLSQRKAAILNHFKATRHNNVVVVKKCFRDWIQYWMRRRHKKQEKEALRAMNEKQLVVKTFRYWVEQYQLRRAVAEHQEKMQHLAQIFQLRRTFVHWQHYVYLRHEKQLMIADAEDHYERKLMVAGLTGFRLGVVQRRLKTMRLELADQHRNKQLMLLAWNQWLSRCEDNEELRIITETRRARKHYSEEDTRNGRFGLIETLLSSTNISFSETVFKMALKGKTLMQKCFNQLQYYCSWRKHRESQYARAEAHYYMHVVPQYLFRMKIFVQLMRNNRQNRETAEAFRRENVQARFFYQWVNMYEFSKEYRMNERMAILHYDDTMLKRFFMSWKHGTIEAVQEAENEEFADHHYRLRFCRNHLMAWKLYIDELKASQRHEIVASRHYCERGLRQCLGAWRKYTLERRKKHRQTDKAVLHYNRTVCKKMITMWLHYVDTQRAIKQQVDLKYRAKCHTALGDAFHLWKDNVALQIQEREADQHADQHHAEQILSKVLRTWHRYAAIHAYKKSETRQWVQSATEELNSRKLRIYFTRWQIDHSEKALERLQTEKADNHHNARVKHATIQIWKTFTKESIRKKLLRKQSDWFHHVRLTARFFTLWKHAHCEALVENEKTNIALWHWCLNLHRKVLIGWFSYVQQRKHKKQRIADAMERRRCRLLRDGVTQWLLVANDLREMRMKFAAQQQAKSAYEISQLVLRIGLHWKHWAQKQVRDRGGPRPLPPKPTSARLSSTRPVVAQHPLPLYEPVAFGSVNPRPSVSAPVSARSEGHQSARPKSPAPDLKAHVSAVSPARSTKSEYSRSQLRARPRRPDFLVESLKRAGLFSPGPSSQSEKIDPAIPETHKPQVLSRQKKEEIENADQVIERLNLSNLSGDRSDTDTIPFKSTPHSGPDLTRHFGVSGSHVDQPSSKNTDSTRAANIKDLTDDKGKCVFISPSAPNVQTNLPKLLTPADFMSKQASANLPRTELTSHGSFIPSVRPDINTNTVPVVSDAQDGFDSKLERSVGSKQLNEIHYEYTIHSESHSVASTPRVLCQSAEHSHPLSQTYTVNPGNVRGVTLTSSREVTPRSATAKGDISEATSTEDVQKEIVRIRNKLKKFEQKKKKLRTMQKHMKQLSDWLREEEAKGHNSDDEDIQNAQQEVLELSSDVCDLKQTIEEEKAVCSGLVDRVKTLTAHLSRT